MSEVQAEQSYLEQRHEVYGITDDFVHTSVNASTSPVHGEGIFEMRSVSWFSSDNQNNIKILFKTLENRQLVLHTDGRKTATHIYRTCLSPANRARQAENGHEARYLQPAGTPSIIFNTQGVIDSYLNKEKVNTLYLIEGEYKAFVAWMHSVMWEPTKKQREDEPNLPPATGLPIMGLCGIWNFRDEDKNLHRDILEYIRVCRPENVVFIYDADLKSLPKGYDPEDTPDKDLGKRLKMFYDSAMTFRNLAKGHVKDVYVTWINPDLMKKTVPGTDTTVKGLDDLFASDLRKPKLLLYDLCKSIRPGTRNEFFETVNISSESPLKLKEHFLLKLSKSGPQTFYLYHSSVLQEHNFIFLRNRYRYNQRTGFVELVDHGDSKEFIRVASKYFRVVYYPDAYGNTVRDLIPWAKGEISEDYVKQGYTNFFQTIAKYNRFVNIPENDPKKFQQVLFDCYNLYYPLEYQLEQGKWPTIEMYLRHIFKDQYELGLDWISLTFNKPTQNLPSICLVSKEKSTGKSKFIELMQLLYENNAVMIGNSEITDTFNDDYVTKLIIGIDEGLLEKKATVEKLKSWITGRYVQMNTKFLSRSRVDMFAKIILTSNNDEDFIRIDDDESRFWVRYVHPFEGEEIPDLLDLMGREIPQFAYYLKNEHKVKHEKKTRLYFDPKLYETESLQKLRGESKTQMYKDIEIIIQEAFMKYNGTPGQTHKFTRLYYTITELSEAIYGKTSGQRQYVRKTLQREFRIDTSVQNISAKMPVTTQAPIGSETVEVYEPGPARSNKFIEFKIEDFFTDEQIESLGIDPKTLTSKTAEPYPGDGDLPF